MLILNRLVSDFFSTRGVFVYDKRVVCHSFELPWRNNMQDKSCIPPGEYDVIKASSSRFSRMFYIKDVPARTGILIHPGNTARDTRGCILPGLDVDDVGVGHSLLAMDRLYSVLPSSFKLLIREV